MAREKNLSTIVKSEQVKVQMVPGRIVLRPRGQATVELRSGGFDKIDVDAVAIEAEGEYNMGTYSRLYNLDDPKDRETIELLKEKLRENPHWSTHADYQIKIVGEYDAGEPWPGYDEQSAEQIEAFYRSMPDQVRRQHPLEQVMKHELERVDEDGEPAVDEEKVKVLNKLYREADTAAKDAAEEVVAL